MNEQQFFDEVMAELAQALNRELEREKQANERQMAQDIETELEDDDE